MARKGKIRWGAVLNAIVGISAALADPHLLNVLPAKLTAAAVVCTTIVGAILKPAVRKEYERAP